MLLTASGAWSAGKTKAAHPAPIEAFKPGEILTYDVSWSKVAKAGTTVMEVKREQSPDGRDILRFIVTSRTSGAVQRVYPLGDTVQSVFDPQIMQTLSYSLNASHGKRKRNLEMVFDHARRKVTSRLNEDPPQILDIPDPVQDTLSALYYLRTRQDFIEGKPITFEVFDRGKSVTMEVQTLGREKVKTPAGEFSAIKIKVFKGLFMGDGEVLIWLTDDIRKIPVFMKGAVKIGSIQFMLKELKP